jgi:hypothetical protein
MNKQRPLLLLALVVYIFSPALYGWVTDPTTVWYKPYIIWAMVIVAAYIMQARSKHHDL